MSSSSLRPALGPRSVSDMPPLSQPQGSSRAGTEARSGKLNSGGKLLDGSNAPATPFLPLPPATSTDETGGAVRQPPSLAMRRMTKQHSFGTNAVQSSGAPQSSSGIVDVNSASLCLGSAFATGAVPIPIPARRRRLGAIGMTRSVSLPVAPQLEVDAQRRLLRDGAVSPLSPAGTLEFGPAPWWAQGWPAYGGGESPVAQSRPASLSSPTIGPAGERRTAKGTPVTARIRSGNQPQSSRPLCPSPLAPVEVRVDSSREGGETSAAPSDGLQDASSPDDDAAPEGSGDYFSIRKNSVTSCSSNEPEEILTPTQALVDNMSRSSQSVEDVKPPPVLVAVISPAWQGFEGQIHPDHA